MQTHQNTYEHAELQQATLIRINEKRIRVDLFKAKQVIKLCLTHAYLEL
jgi:hypothetical protein